MTTLEKLFIQIFERKDRIIDQLQQQADSYTQQLASKLLIDGITPPAWLLSPSSNSNPSDPNVLENEKVISKLLLRPPRVSTRYSTGGGSLYYQPVGGADINKQLSTAMCIEAHAPNSTINLRSEPVMTRECHNNDTVGSLGHVEVDDSGRSPQNETDARITSIHEAHDMSLARIQRSKSRQKARELRTSGKTTDKICSGNERRAHVSFSGDLKCKKDFNQIFQDIFPPDAGKLNIVSGETSMAEDGRGEKGVDSTSHSGRLAKSSSSCEIPSLENEHNQIGSSSDKEELGGCIMVEPACDSQQQSCRVNGVKEVVNLSDVSLGSYVGQKSISGRTQATQSQNNLFSGRITRSKSSIQQTGGINKSSQQGTQSQSNLFSGRITRSKCSIQQTSGINKSPKLGISVSCNPIGGGAPSHFVGDLKHEVSITNKLVDAAETSEVVGDINAETQAICSNVGVLKPVLPSYMDTKESSFGANHQENTEIVVAKQLNFDEIDKCDLNEISRSLSKKRKLDGSSMDQKSSCSFFEQQLPKENATSISPKSAGAQIGLETNTNPVVEAESNSKFSLHDDTNLTNELVLSPKRFDNEFDEETRSEKSPLEDHASLLKMQTKEDDLSNKGKESAVGDSIPVSNIKSACTSSLTKKVNNVTEDCLDKAVNKPEVDLDSSKSKELEVVTNAMLYNMKLNSTKVFTWPLNQQKHVEDQPNCFSDSRNFRARIQREAIHCDLGTPENDEMISVFSEGAETLPEIQAAEEIVAEVNGDISELTDTLKQSVSTGVLNDEAAVTNSNNFEIKLPDWVSSYGSVQSPQDDDKTMFVSDEITPVYEGFIIGEDIGNVDMENNEGGIDFDTLKVPTTTTARARKHLQTIDEPLSLSQLYQIMEDSRKHLQTIDSGISGIDSTFPQQQKVDYGTPFYWEFPQQQKVDYGTPFYWESKNLYSSPVGKPWERSASSSGSSEMQLGSNPDLTCFPIEEDPSNNEESDELQENINPTQISTETKIEKRENDDDVAVEIQEPPVESTEVCGQHGNHVSMASMKYPNRYISASVSIEVSVPRTREIVKHKPKVPRGIKVSRYEEIRGSSIATRASSRGNVSVNSKNSSMRSRILKLSQKEAQRNNIVSNVTSFIPMVQQKQAAAICTGKRDIKVKALEAAEAAKRREEERENERKQKKEALKLERARIEKENAKEILLKKKEAEMARKRHREEEEERKQLAKKRKPAVEAQKYQNLKNEKSKHVKNAAVAGNKKNSANPRQNKNINNLQKQDNELRIDKTLASVVPPITSVPENNDASNDCNEKEKATSVHERSPVKVVQLNLTNQENSYDITPYQSSDDEDDEEDDRPTKKFIPSWASKSCVAMVLPSQQDIDPESIFPVYSFCSMDKVLLPRRIQAL